MIPLSKVKDLILKHSKETNSLVSEKIIKNFDNEINNFLINI